MKAQLFALFILLIIFGCSELSNPDTTHIDPKATASFLTADYMQAGGATTIYSRTSGSFSFPAPGLSEEELDKHQKGDDDFEARFVSSGTLNPGLGSVFNHNSCIGCHVNDGRAAFPERNINAISGLLVRISIPGVDSRGLAPVDAPGFGGQVQNHAIQGMKPEADYAVRFETVTEDFPDGSKVDLRKPIITLDKPYQQLPQGVLLSPRIAPPMIGLGLLEAIPEADIRALQDENDKDGDGISGRVNEVWNPSTQKIELGRFGWKANTPTIEVQAAAAYNNDMGITSHLFPKETCEGQSNCATSQGTTPEITKDILDAVVFYSQTLAVPAPKTLSNAKVIQGAALFQTIGCAKCHVPKMQTGNSSIAVLSNQTIYPYTDMLLHDMGEGLSDNRPDGKAEGNEWKTRPLWGIGLTFLINGHTYFLHDGRARNLQEAILWHGGEAQHSKEEFKKRSKEERESLIAFLNAL